MSKKIRNLNFRITDEDYDYLLKAYKAYKKANKERITLSEYVRRLIKNAGAVELQIVTRPEPVKWPCACVEVHTCKQESV